MHTPNCERIVEYLFSKLIESYDDHDLHCWYYKGYLAAIHHMYLG